MTDRQGSNVKWLDRQTRSAYELALIMFEQQNKILTIKYNTQAPTVHQKG